MATFIEVFYIYLFYSTLPAATRRALIVLFDIAFNGVSPFFFLHLRLFLGLPIKVWRSLL